MQTETKDTLTVKNIKRRAKAETPSFWKKVRTVALAISGVAGVILTAPVSLPAAIVTAAGYVATASASIAVLSQLTKEDSGDDTSTPAK